MPQPLEAPATYLSELRSDDGVLQCGRLPLPEAGESFAIGRVLGVVG